MLLLVFDTGIRASELCGLSCGDIDLQAGLCRITSGKGGKSRTAPFGRAVKRALYQYMNERYWEDYAPLFVSDEATERAMR